MRRLLGIFLVGILLSTTGLFAQSRGDAPNDVSLELGGKCIIYSLSYQRMLGKAAGLEVGASYIGGGTGEGSVGVLFLSGGLRLYLLDKDASPCLAAGAVYVTAGTEAGPFDESTSGFYFYVTPGFEYRFSGGFLFRGGVNFLIREGFWVWPGISVGIAF